MYPGYIQAFADNAHSPGPSDVPGRGGNSVFKVLDNVQGGDVIYGYLSDGSWGAIDNIPASGLSRIIEVPQGLSAGQFNFYGTNFGSVGSPYGLVVALNGSMDQENWFNIGSVTIPSTGGFQKLVGPTGRAAFLQCSYSFYSDYAGPAMVSLWMTIGGVG